MKHPSTTPSSDGEADYWPDSGVNIITEDTAKRLNERQRIDYEHFRRSLATWMHTIGKDKRSGKGYATETVRRRLIYQDMIYRWLWDDHGGYTTQLTQDHLDAFIAAVARSDYSDSYQVKLLNTCKMLWRYYCSERGQGGDWEPEYSFSDSNSKQPKEHLSQKERRKIREAALEVGTVPHYCALTPEERDEWKEHLSYRYRKPKSEIGQPEFERANGFKIPSLVWMSLDCGLRPVEVARCRVSWVDVDNALVRIPASEAAKSDENWEVSIQRQTADILEHWIKERPLYGRYQDTERMWLTREGNPYRSHSLKYLLEKLCREAEISTENRELTWYAIRHGLGTGLSAERGLEAARVQLRHESTETTMKYDNVTSDEIRSILGKLG